VEQDVAGPSSQEDAVDQVRTVVIDLVDDVVSARRAHGAYAVFTHIGAFTDEGYEYDDVYRSFVGTALVLAAAASQAARTAGQDGTEAVRWVRKELGVWASTAAARAGALGAGGSSQSVGAGPDLADVQDDLREHLLPAIIWFLAGTRAVALDGEKDRLRRVPAFS
jgi:hypothetical protein